jgi:hypothetical protein
MLSQNSMEMLAYASLLVIAILFLIYAGMYMFPQKFTGRDEDMAFEGEAFKEEVLPAEALEEQLIDAEGKRNFELLYPYFVMPPAPSMEEKKIE